MKQGTGLQNPTMLKYACKTHMVEAWTRGQAYMKIKRSSKPHELGKIGKHHKFDKALSKHSNPYDDRI